MTRKTPSTPAEFWQIFLRRRWWFLVPAVVVPMIVFGWSVRLPRLYRSETLILVDPQKVPEQYVPSTVNGDVASRLQTISQEILSRTRLQRIVEQFGLYRDLKAAKRTDEDVIDAMRQDISLDIVTDPRESKPGVGGFKIAYLGRDPQLAQQVTSKIASLFIEENLKVREQQAAGTSEFIGSELEKAKINLQAQEEKVKGFKLRYMGGLPEQQQSNLQLLGQLQGLLQTNSDAIGRAQQQKSYLESILQTIAKMQPDAVSSRSPLENELEARKGELIGAEQKYLPDHPDVIRLRQEVKALQAKIAEDRKLNPAPSEKPGQSPDQVKVQVTGLEQEIRTRTAQQALTEQKIRGIQARVDSLPAVEQQFTELSRDYEISKANYQSLLAKNNGASMSEELERRAKGEQFKILDPANLPEKPFKPNLPQLNSMGIIAGLCLGLALSALMEYRDHTVHDKLEMAYYFSVPVLATMPVIVTQEGRALRSKQRKIQLALGSVVGLIAFVIGILFLRSRDASGLMGRF